MKQRTKTYLIVGFALTLSLFLIILLGLYTGSHSYSISQIISALLGYDFPNSDSIRGILLALRLPRVLLAIIAGSVLTLGGFFMQALIKNPLADPYIMGVTAGAGLGVNLVILGLIPIVHFTVFTTPIFAALGGVCSLMIVLVLGFKTLVEDNARLLIAGVAVSSLFTALTGILIYVVAESDQIRQIIFWTFGSLHRANWESVYISFSLLLLGLIYAIIKARSLDILLLGDMDARVLGAKVRQLKLEILLVTSLIVGGTVAFTGPIGFIGMMIPHFSRSILGIHHRSNVIFGSILGGIFLAACDMLSQHILPPAGLPIGIVTAVLGVPFFLYLLFKDESHL